MLSLLAQAASPSPATGAQTQEAITNVVRSITWQSVGIGILIVLVASALAWAARRAAEQFLRRVIGRSPSSARALAEIFRWVIIALSVAAALIYVFPSVKPVNMIGGIGVVSVAAGIAFQTVLGNMFAGLVILMRETPVVGDQVKVGEVAGTITNITLSNTTIRTFNGRQVLVPNGVLHESVVTIQTRHEQVRTHFTVGIQDAADFGRARQVAVAGLRDVPEVLADPAPVAVLTDIDDGLGVMEVRFWSGSRQMDTVSARDAAIVAVTQSLTDAGIAIGPTNEVRISHAPTPTAPTPPASTSPASSPSASAPVSGKKLSGSKRAGNPGAAQAGA